MLKSLLLMKNRLQAAKQLIHGRQLSNALNSWQELLPFGRRGLLLQQAGHCCPPLSPLTPSCPSGIREWDDGDYTLLRVCPILCLSIFVTLLVCLSIFVPPPEDDGHKPHRTLRTLLVPQGVPFGWQGCPLGLGVLQLSRLGASRERSSAAPGPDPAVGCGAR